MAAAEPAAAGVAAAGVDAVVRQYEPESARRRLRGPWGFLVSVLAVGFSLFELWTNSFGLLLALRQGAIFLAFTLVLVFLLFPASRRSSRDRPSVPDLVLACLGAAVGLYTFFTFVAFAERNLQPVALDLAFAGLAILLVLEAARRATGPWLPSIALVFLLYALFGRYAPGPFAHRGFTLERLLIRMYLVDEGIYGITLVVAATYVFLFVLFGAFLQASGAGEFFSELALALTGWSAGGPAKVAIFSSSLFGTISGSAVANVAVDGIITIPLMKRAGYRTHVAAAIEAAASTGGQIMPPVMGAAAFVMAEFLNIPYPQIALAAAIPALLYYGALFASVHLEAVHTGLRGLPRKELPRLGRVLWRKGHLLIPLLAVIYVFTTGMTPLFAGFVGILAVVVVSQLRRETRMGPRKIWAALREGALGCLGVASACAVVGFVVGVTVMTGVGQAFAHNIVRISGNQLFVALLLSMIACIILSMGLPSTACYIVVATVAAPALVNMGAIPLAAHMFVFYFGVLSNLTPPVALASYTAAGLCGANPSQVGWTGLRLTLAGFIIPFMFVYNPELLLQGENVGWVALAVGTAVAGITCLAIADRGYFLGTATWPERAALFAAALLLIKPGPLTDAIGGAMVAAVAAMQCLRLRRARAVAPGRAEPVTSHALTDGGEDASGI